MVDMNKVLVLRDQSGVLADARRREGPNISADQIFGEVLRFDPAPIEVETLSPGQTPRSALDPEAVTITSEDATSAQEGLLASEADVVAVARAMPLSIIEAVPDALVSDDQRHTDHSAAAADLSVAWGIEAVGADATLATGENVTVAVLDTGIDANHAAFDDPSLSLILKNFTADRDEDTNGHGTHCAGTIFGRDVDGTRIGVAPGVRRALIGKVIGRGGDSAALINGMQWAVNQGANIISMSLGFDFPAYQQALEARGVPQLAATSMALQAYRNNIRLFDNWMGLNAAFAHTGKSAIVIAAAGNESNRGGSPPYEIAASSPAAATGIVSVGAVANGGGGLSVANFSNNGPAIAGPGVSVQSAKLGGGLAALNGTSMACPHVAGVAALHWDEMSRSHIEPNPDRVRSRLMASAEFAGQFLPEVTANDVGVGICKAP